MKLITEQVSDLSFVTEEIAGKKSLFVEGVFLQADVKNKNGRMYPKEILQYLPKFVLNILKLVTVLFYLVF